MQWQDLTKQQKIYIISGVVILLIIAVIAIFSAPLNSLSNTQNEFQEISSTDNPTIEPTQSTYFVEITGYVKNPGVYELDHEMMVLELIELAGNITSDADLLSLHKDLPLSTFVKPNQKIYIPSKSSASLPSDISSTATQSKVSLNNSSKDELMSLSGVGEVTAQKIIDNRPYSKLEDLLNVSGIGEVTYNKLIPYISL